MAVDLRKAHEEGLNGAVAAELRAEKAAQNLTNQDIAERSGVPVVSVQRYLAPKRAIDMIVLEQLASALGKTPSEIVAAAEQRYARQMAEARRIGDVIDRARADIVRIDAEGKPTVIELKEYGAPRSDADVDQILSRAESARRRMQQIEDQAARDEDSKR